MFRRVWSIVKATVSFVMSVCLSAWTGRIFITFDIRIFSRKSYRANFFLEWEMVQTKCVEKIKSHILCSVRVLIFQKSYLLWDNVEKYCRAGQATGDSMAHAGCWLIKTTNTHAEYIILIASPLQQWLHERASVTSYVHCRFLISRGYSRTYRRDW